VLIGMLIATEWLLRRRRFPHLTKKHTAGDDVADDVASEGIEQ
jgi:hypothetical protein